MYLPDYCLAYDENGFALVFWAEPALRKANEPLQPGERWITLKPHGPDHEAYIHVKIRENPDGSAHVIGGPKALTGLRLRKLGTAEDWKRRAKQKAQATPEERARRVEEMAKLEPAVHKARQRVLEAAARLTQNPAFEALLEPDLKETLKEVAKRSITPITANEEDAADAEPAVNLAAGLAAASQVRKVESAVKKLERELIKTLIDNDELRREVLSNQELEPPEPSAPKKSPGYQRNLKEEAAQQGFGPRQAKTEADKFFQKRLEEAEPEQAARMLAARARMIEAQQLRPLAAITTEAALPKPKIEITPEKVAEEAAHVRAFIEANRQLKELRKAQRKIAFGKDPTLTPETIRRMTREPTGAPLEIHLSDEARQDIEQSMEAMQREDLMRNFLGQVEATADGLDYKQLRDAMHGAHATGAYGHLSNVSLAVLGDNLLDRSILDHFGTDAAVQMLARALHKRLPKEDVDALRKALEEEHEAHLARIPEAMQKAQALLDAARSFEIPPITDSTDGMAVQRMLDMRRETIEEARDVLGTVLGQVEASAALNMALQQAPQEKMTLNMGVRGVRDVAPILRALGLKEGQYEYEKSGDQLLVHVGPDGLDALMEPQDEALAELRKTAAAIKNGELDEDDYLPPGFTRYPASAFDSDPPRPQRMATPGIAANKPIKEALEEAVYSRLADGWTPAELKRLLGSLSFVQDWVPENKQGEYYEHLETLLPTYDGKETRTNKDGEKYEVDRPVDYTNLEARHPEIARRIQEAARQWVQTHRPDQVHYLDQKLEDTPDARKALYLALMQDPRTQVAYKPLGELTPQDQRAIRHYYLTEVLGKSPEEIAQRKEAVAKALEQHDQRNPEPPKFGSGSQAAMFWDEQDFDPNKPITLTFRARGGAFAEDDQRLKAEAIRSMGLGKGDYVENENGSITLTESGKANVRPPSAHGDIVEGLALSPDWRAWHGRRKQIAAEAMGDDLVEWAEFVDTLKGPHRAYNAVLEHMRGAVTERFNRYHANLTGKPFTTTKKTNPWGDVLWQIRDPEGFAEFQKQVQAEAGRLRERQGGKFAYMGGAGSLLEAYRAKKEADKAAQSAQVALFAGATGDPALEPDPPLPNLERHALPEGVENRLASMMQAISGPIRPLQNPVNIIPDRTMGRGTKYVKQQRAIKHLLAAKKTGLFLGTGSGKSSVMIGMGTELLNRGEARKVIMGVPSVVRDQMGEEMAMTLEPGRYRWHAREGTFAERKAALKDPNTHFVAITHQSLRDDLLRIMAEHHGQDVEQFTQRFVQAPLEERQKLMKKALEAENIPLDFLAFDEAHDFLGRDGKPDSIMQRVFDTAMSLSKYGTYATGSPLKNDMSEIADWLAKIDPQRFGDKDEFMRRYGLDAQASREAVKRFTDPHFFVDSVPANTVKRVVWGADGTQGDSPSGHGYVPLHPAQKEALEALGHAYRRLQRAQRQGKVDVEAAQMLSPESFTGVPPEAHEEVARRIQANLGIIHHAAQNRIINEHPPEQNGKVQHVMKLLEARRGQGTVIFARNRAAVEMLAEEAQRQGHKVAVLHGGHSAQEKARIRSRFNRGEVDVIVSSDAGQVGANLQHRGHHLIQYDVPMTQKSWEQRSARIDRLGQKKAIELHTVLSDTDFDRENYERIAKKKMMGSIFQGTSENLDETGLALRYRLAKLNRDGQPEPEESPQKQQNEPQAALF